MIDQLESRVLLSTGGTPDPGFGQGGYLKGYQVLAVEQEGSLIARQDTSSGSNLVQLHPDGSFEAAYSGQAPTPPPTNVEDGKYLVINGQSLTTGNTLTRYNADGSVDTTFGNNGTVSDFTSGTGYPAGAFNPENVTVDKGAILVSGPLNLGGEGHDSVTAMVQLFYNGSIDHTFGTNGIAQGTDVSGINDVRTYQTLAGPNGNYFVSGEFDGRPLLTEFSSTNGAYINSAHLINSGEDHVYSVGFSAKNVYLLADWTSTEVALAAYDLNLNPDTGFGNNGLVVVTPPDHPSTQMPEATVPGPMLIDPDGRVFVSARISYLNTPNSGGDYAITYLPDWGANTSVSGSIYNDANRNGQRDTGESPLRYWQAFVDLNGNGIYDAGEPTAYADYNGYYKIHALDPGTYKVYEVAQPQLTLTQPPSVPYHTFTVSSGQVATGNDFGNADLNTFDANGNILSGYSAQQVLPNGVIVALDSTGKIVGLNPDGTIDATFNPATDVPSTPLPGVYQPDGKRLVLDTTNSTITRYNADGSIDRMFGTNGTFSSFAQQPTRYFADPTYFPYQSATFTPKMIAMQGNNIIVVGTMNGTDRNGNSFSNHLAVERITANGFQDNGFGVVAYEPQENVPSTDLNALYVANGGQIYVLGTNIFEDPFIVRVSGDGTAGNDIIPTIDIPDSSAIAPDGSLVIEGLVLGGYPPGMYFVQQFNADLSLRDESWIGPQIPNFDPISDWVDTNGHLLIAPDGNAFISASYGYESQQYGNFLIRLSLAAPTGSGSISGYIYNDANGNGVIDSGEQPLRYAQAFVDLNGNGKFDLGEPTAYADYNGYYQINGVAPGTYQVYEVPQAGYTQDAPSATPYRTVTVTAGNTTTGVDFGNRVGTAPQPGSISGTFFYDSNTNGTWDSGEAPSPYWGVYIDANNDGKYDSGDTELIANGAGQYTFKNLAPGTYIIRGTTAPGWTQTFPANGGAQTVTIGSGQAVTSINFGEFHGAVSAAKGSISGTFFYDSNHNGVRDSGEPISPYWGVYIDANNDGKFDSGDTELIANSKGQFTFPNLPAGTYVIRGTTASGWTQTSPANGGAQVVTITAGQNLAGINFGEYHGVISTAKGSISGTFFYDGNANGIWDTRETDSPSWGVYIDANDDGFYDSGDTELIANARGQYTFSNLSAGTYVIRATTASGWKQTYPANGGAQVITLAAGQNVTGINFGKVRT